MRKEIIKSWNDINLNQYIELREIATEEGIDESERNLQILSILLDCTVEELENMPLLKLKTYSGALGFLQSPPQPGKTRRTYKLRGTEYKVFKDFNGITTSQFIDFQTYAKDPDKNIKELLGVILIPSGHNYNEGYDLSDTIELIGETLNVPDALSLLSFFFEEVRKINSRFPSIFLSDDEEVGEEIGEDEPGESRGNQEETGDSGFYWLTVIDVVSETLRISWLKVFNLPAVEFLSYFLYYKMKKAKEKEAMEQFKRQNKLH